MASILETRRIPKTSYPTSDGRPMAETDVHRDLMIDLIQTLDARFAPDPNIYVSGNLLVFYKKGDRRKHLSPDVFVVKGVAKRKRDNYLIWNERKGLDAVIELTSSSTREEDVEDKFELYQDELRVPEYFLFDPHLDYLDPPLQGYRLKRKKYQPIPPVDGRLPSEVLGLHLERRDTQLRLYDPATKQILHTPLEMASHVAEIKAENARLQRELETLRRGKGRNGK